MHIEFKKKWEIYISLRTALFSSRILSLILLIPVLYIFSSFPGCDIPTTISTITSYVCEKKRETFLLCVASSPFLSSSDSTTFTESFTHFYIHVLVLQLSSTWLVRKKRKHAFIYPKALPPLTMDENRIHTYYSKPKQDFDFRNSIQLISTCIDREKKSPS